MAKVEIRMYIDKGPRRYLFWVAFCLLGIGVSAAPAWGQSERDPIRPYADNPYYWEYKGEPVLLLGGSWQDNLFNHPSRLENHLDILQEMGGNYVRNTMSSRNEGNVWPFAKAEGGLYDLEEWNEEYWDRLERFLQLTYERDIIVQIEIWDPWDFFVDHQTQGGWSHNPFNPENNVTYMAESSGLPTEVEYEPGPSPSEHAFFRTVPDLQDNEEVRRYQEAYVDRLLEITFQYPHVLYCMNNETGEKLAWGDFWLRYVREKAKAAGKEIYTTDMRRNEDLRAEDHAFIYDQPGRYTFLDVSQNNTRQDQTHYDRLMHVRERIATEPRPINNVKIYTFNGGPIESTERFWRNVFAGAASSRFHRPHPLEHPDEHLTEHGAGIGLSPRAQAHIRSARLLTEELGVFTSTPRNDLLRDRADNEAYMLADPGRAYAVYFPTGGAVTADLSKADGELKVRWLNLERSTWTDPGTLSASEAVKLEAPGKGAWAVLIQAE